MWQAQVILVGEALILQLLVDQLSISLDCVVLGYILSLKYIDPLKKLPGYVLLGNRGEILRVMLAPVVTLVDCCLDGSCVEACLVGVHGLSAGE